MALGIFHQCGRMVETHRLIVKYGRRKCREVMAFKISARVGEQRKTGGVRFRKSVERERRNGLDNLILHATHDAVLLHASPEFHFNVAHTRFRTLEAEGATEFLSFAPGESGRHHRDANQLLLEQRYPQCAFEDRLQRRMCVRHLLPSLPAVNIWVYHLAHDGARANERHLYDNVVERYRMQSRQTGHLRATFYLEHADGIGLLQSREDFRIIGGKQRQIDLFAIVLRDQVEAILEHGHHAESQQIYFNDTHVGAIFLVPLHDDTVGHAGRFQRNDGIELSLADDHAAGMLAEMAR